MIDWTEELEDSICSAIAINPKGLEAICAENESFPSPAAIYIRLNKSKDFVEKYARAREMQLQVLADELVPLADQDRICKKRTIKADGSEEIVILDQVERTRLQIETRKWLLGKLAPKKYGDKVQNEHSGPDGGPIQAEISVKLVQANAPSDNPEG